MTWNIRTGGRDRGGPDRLDQVVRVVAEQAPDVLALQELRGFDRDGLLAAVRGPGGDAPAPGPLLLRAAGGGAGPPAAAGSLDAGPVRRPFHHAAHGSWWPPPPARSPCSAPTSTRTPGLRRRVEAGWLVAAVRRAPGELALLAGDLNSLDPSADHTDRLARLPAALPAAAPAPRRAAPWTPARSPGCSPPAWSTSGRRRRRRAGGRRPHRAHPARRRGRVRRDAAGLPARHPGGGAARRATAG